MDVGIQNWADLPSDVLDLIFAKIRPSEILLTAQFVCSAWSNLSTEPRLFRSLDLRDQAKIFAGDNYKMRKVAWEACKRSCGGLIEFSTDDDFAVDDDLLHYIVDNSKSLKCLRLGSMDRISIVCFVEAISKVPLLEELELSESLCDCGNLCYCWFTRHVVGEIGRLCSKLSSFTLRRHRDCRSIYAAFSFEFAYAIGRHMSQLRCVGLSKILLTDYSLQVMMDGCPNLEHLDLEHCYYYNYIGGKKLSGKLQARFDEIKFVKLPYNAV